MSDADRTPEEQNALDRDETIEDLDVPEEQRDDVSGGAVDMFLKIEGIKGE